jgi:hypothetical protein
MSKRLFRATLMGLPVKRKVAGFRFLLNQRG